MQGSLGAVDRYRQEYVLYQVIRENNELADEMAMNDRIVYTTEARALSKRIFSRRDELISTEQISSDDAFVQAVNEVLGNKWTRPPFGEDNVQFEHFNSMFAEVSGFGLGSTQSASDMEQYGYAIPISPFDSRFAMRESVWSAGSEMLFARNADIERQGLVLDQLEDGRLTRGVWLKRRRSFTDKNSGELVTEYTDAGALYKAADLAGLSALRPYIDQIEYRQMSRHLSNTYSKFFQYDAEQGSYPITFENDRGYRVRLDDAVREGMIAARMAEAVVRDRVAKGREFSLNVERLGQIELVDEDANMAIRLFGNPGEKSAGRIRDVNTSVNYYWQLSTSSENHRRNAVPDEWRTGAVAVRAFSWACGEPAQMRADDGRVIDIGDPSYSIEYDENARVRINYAIQPVHDENGNIIYKDDGNPLTERVPAVSSATGEPQFMHSPFVQHGNFYTSKNRMSVSIARGRVVPVADYAGRRDGSRRVRDVHFEPARKYGQTGDSVMIQLHGDYAGWDVNYKRFQIKGDSEAEMERSRAAAREYIRDAVESARLEVWQELDVDAIVSSAMSFVYNEDDDIDLSEGCTSDEIRDMRETLLGMLEGVVSIDGYDNAYSLEPGTPEFVVDTETYVRELAAQFVDTIVGEYTEIDVDGQIQLLGTFNINGVSQYNMNETEGRTRDTLIYAMRRLGMVPEDFEDYDEGNRRLADRLVQFEDSTAVSLAQIYEMQDDAESWAFRREAMETVRSAIHANMGVVSDEDIEIDGNGIIRYKVKRISGQTQSGRFMGDEWSGYSATGQVGPIFERTDRGTFVTRFASSDNFELVPQTRGYMMVPSGEGESRYERMRGISFEDEFLAKLRTRVALDVRSAKKNFDEIGTPWSMAKAWRSGSHERLSLEHDDVMVSQGMDAEIDAARIEAMHDTVSFGSKVGRDAGIIQHLHHMNSGGAGERFNDNADDLYHRYGFMGVADAEGDNLFDYVWPSSADSQSHKRVLKPGAALHTDRPPTMVPYDVDARLKLNELDISQYSEYDSWARRVMFLQNVMSALRVTEPVGVSLMSFGGRTTEDGVVISQRFASTYMVDNGDGEMRPLMAGDKVSDCHGNKGVVGLVIDSNWDEEEAEKRGVVNEWRVFHDNPDLDVVMSPFSLLSRLNAGTLREAVGRGDAVDLVVGDDVVEGGIGHMAMVVHDKTAEAKTTETDHRAGWQATGVMYALGCDEILKDIYGNGGFGESRFSETIMASMGAQISDEGNIVPFDAESAQRIDLPDMSRFFAGIEANTQTDRVMRYLKSDFTNNLDATGGILELPCELTFPDLPPVQFAKDEIPEGLEHLVTEKRIGKNVVYELAFGGQTLPKVEGIWDTGDERTCEAWHDVSDGTWALPVMSRQMREGTKSVDGMVVRHNYTWAYSAIYQAAMGYVAAKMNGDEEMMLRMQHRMQANINSIGSRLYSQELSGKWNVAKSEMLTHKIDNSPYAVWSGDPTANLEEIHVSPNLMKAMKLKDGDTVVIMRHPVLKEGCAVSLTVRKDETLHGFAVNPCVAGIIGGDFDGDQVVVWKPKSKAALEEAKDRLNVGEYLLNRGKVDDQGRHPLALGMGADVASALSRKPELAERVDEIVTNLNNLETVERTQGRAVVLQTCVSNLNDVIKEALSDEYGKSAISFTDLQSSLQSVLDTSIAKHVKGSVSAFEKLCQAVGANVELTDEGNDHYSIARFEDVGHTLLTREGDESVMCATTAKQDYTGVSGKEMQFAIAAFENDPETMRAALRIVEKLYQKTLDWKHSGEEAMQEAPFIDVAKHALNARMLDIEDLGGVVYDDNHEPVKDISPDRYVKQLAWCLDKLGQDYDRHDIERMASALSTDNVCVGMRDKAMSDASFVLRCAMSERADDFAIAYARGENMYGEDGGLMSKIKPVGAHRAMDFAQARSVEARQPVVAEDSISDETPQMQQAENQADMSDDAVAAVQGSDEDLVDPQQADGDSMKLDRAKVAKALERTHQKAAQQAEQTEAMSVADRVRQASRGVTRRSAADSEYTDSPYGDEAPMKFDRATLRAMKREQRESSASEVSPITEDVSSASVDKSAVLSGAKSGGPNGLE